MRDDLQMIRDKTVELELKMDRVRAPKGLVQAPSRQQSLLLDCVHSCWKLIQSPNCGKSSSCLFSAKLPAYLTDLVKRICQCQWGATLSHTPAAAAFWLLQEVNDIRAGMEKAKNDIIKSTIAIMGTFSAIAFTITRLMAV